MLFNGTTSRTQEQLYADVDRIGAYNNAHTTDFYTDYMMVVPAADLEEGLRIQSQMLFHSRVPEDKFEKEKGIVLGELVAARDDQSRQAVLGPESARALGEVIGPAGEQRELVRGRMVRAHVGNDLGVQGPRAVLRHQCVSGNLDPRAARDRVAHAGRHHVPLEVDVALVVGAHVEHVDDVL